MAHLAVVGKPSRLRFQVTNQLQWQLGNHVSIYTTLAEVAQLIANESVALIVLVDEQINDEHLQVMDEYDNKFPEARMIFVSRQVHQPIREQFISMKLERCVLLDANFEISHLGNMVKKMLLRQPVFVRKHHRHQTKQVGTINSAKLKQNHKIQLQDISQGGLKAGYSRIHVEVGQLVHILVDKNDGVHQHRIIGRIAWHNKNHREFGVQFDSISVERKNSGAVA